MKKLLVSALLSLILSSAVFAVGNFFKDVKENEWYGQAVKKLNEKGILKGYSDNTFRPDNNVNRAELAVIIDRLLDYMEKNQTNAAEAIEKWAIIKNYVTANYPISEKYFDEHFKFKSLGDEWVIRGEYDYQKKEFKPLITGVQDVNYTFSIPDQYGNIQAFDRFTRITLLSDNTVMDTKNIPEKYKNTPAEKAFSTYGYDKLQPTKEWKISVVKEEAIDKAIKNPECSDTEYFDIERTIKNLKLEFVFGKVFWQWQDNLSECRIDAETGEIFYTNQQLAD